MIHIHVLPVCISKTEYGITIKYGETPFGASELVGYQFADEPNHIQKGMKMITASLEGNKRAFHTWTDMMTEYSGTVPINEEHYIGVSISGDAGKVLVLSLTCEIVAGPSVHNILGALTIEWHVTYKNWSRKKGEWSNRTITHEIDSFYHQHIIEPKRRRELERQLLDKLQRKIEYVSDAIAAHNK